LRAQRATQQKTTTARKKFADTDAPTRQRQRGGHPPFRRHPGFLSQASDQKNTKQKQATMGLSKQPHQAKNGLTPWPLGPTISLGVAALAVAIGLASVLLPAKTAISLLLLLSFPFIAALLHVLFNPLERWRHRHIPGFPYKAPFGNLPDIVRAGGLPHLALHATTVYGPTFKIWRGQVCIVITADPDATKKIGSRMSARGAAQGAGGAAGDPLGLGVANPKATGLLLADGERFTMLKRAWQPAFAPSSLKAYAPLLKRAADGAVARLRAEVERKGGNDGAAAVCDVHAILAGMTMAAVGSCAFGVDWDELAAKEEEKGPKNEGNESDNDDDDDNDDARNNNALAATTKNLDQEEWKRMGRMLVHAAEEIFGGTRLSEASRWSLLAMAWPWSTRLVRFFARRFPDEPLVRRVAARQRLDAASRFLIEQARRQMMQNDEAATKTTTKDGKKAAAGVTGIEPGAFIACLLREGAGLSVDDVAVQAQTFMLAGFETTLSTLGFAVALLARHPDKAARLRAAIDAADAARRERKGKDGGDEAEEDAEADADACIPYANAVLDEAMRLFPPGTAVGRSPSAAAAIQASRGGEGGASSSSSSSPPLILPSRPGQPPIVVPSSTRSVQGVLYAVHRSPDVWPKADEFLPERFLPAEHPDADPSLKAASPNAFMPFGCGARMCIGYRFALLEARTALVALFRSFEFEACDGAGGRAGDKGEAPPIRTATGITMGPDGGVWCLVRARGAVGA
jgi:thromboxane-A synthase/cytochrome P450 family 3 subfamily A